MLSYYKKMVLTDGFNCDGVRFHIDTDNTSGLWFPPKVLLSNLRQDEEKTVSPIKFEFPS